MYVLKESSLVKIYGYIRGATIKVTEEADPIYCGKHFFARVKPVPLQGELCNNS